METTTATPQLTINQIYNLSKSELPFTDWLKREKEIYENKKASMCKDLSFLQWEQRRMRGKLLSQNKYFNAMGNSNILKGYTDEQLLSERSKAETMLKTASNSATKTVYKSQILAIDNEIARRKKIGQWTNTASTLAGALKDVFGKKDDTVSNTDLSGADYTPMKTKTKISGTTIVVGILVLAVLVTGTILVVRSVKKAK